jgi:hypothetical protein
VPRLDSRRVRRTVLEKLDVIELDSDMRCTYLPDGSDCDPKYFAP